MAVTVQGWLFLCGVIVIGDGDSPYLAFAVVEGLCTYGLEKCEQLEGGFTVPYGRR